MGGYSTDTPLSKWIIVMTFLLSSFMALAKRRDDMLLYLKGNNVRKAMDGYNLKFLDISISISLSVVLVAYLMYCLSPVTIIKFNSENVYFTFIFVFLGVLRYLQITFVMEKSYSLTKILLKDRIVQLSIILWVITFVIILYKPWNVIGGGL